MIEKIRSDYQFNTDDFTVTCDNDECSNTNDYTVDFGWNELLREMKRDGWISVKDKDGDWINFCCEECKSKCLETK